MTKSSSNEGGQKKKVKNYGSGEDDIVEEGGEIESKNVDPSNTLGDIKAGLEQLEKIEKQIEKIEIEECCWDE